MPLTAKSCAIVVILVSSVAGCVARKNARRGRDVRSERSPAASRSDDERLHQLLLQPGEIGVDGQLGRRRVVRVEVEAHLLGHVEAGAEDEAQVVQHAEPGLRLVGREHVVAERALDGRNRPVAADVEVVPDQPAVRGLGLGVVRVRRREQAAEVRVVGLFVDAPVQLLAQQLEQLPLVVGQAQAGAVRDDGLPLLVHLQHQVGRLGEAVAEQLLEHERDVRHQVDRVIPDDHDPRPVVLRVVLAAGPLDLDLCRCERRADVLIVATPLTSCRMEAAADTSAREGRYEGVLRYYRLAKKKEWQTRDLPWGDEPPIPEARPGLAPERKARRRDLWRSVITQQLQADQFAVEMAAQLLSIAPDHEAKLYYSTMVQDEARHTEAWLRLAEEAGGTAEHDPHLDRLARMFLDLDTLEQKVFLMQVFFERLIIPRFRLIARAAPGTVLEDLCNRLTVDDGIHHG